MTQDDLLSINNLTKNFQKPILYHLNLHFKKGQIYGLLGPNGAGKTTFMKCILGLNNVDEGEIIFKNQHIENSRHSKKRSQIGSLISSSPFLENSSVQSNLQAHLRLMKVQVAPTYQKKICSALGLNLQMNTIVQKLSLGWRQRLAIARAVYHCPQLILLDEPLNGLDPQTVKQVNDLLRWLAQQGACILIASHLLPELEELCDQYLLLKEKQFQVIDLQQLKTKYTNLNQYYLGEVSKH